MELDEKRAKGLCFWCDEKFTFGHKCTNKKLYSLTLEETVEEEEEPLESKEVEEEVEGEESTTLSLHALHDIELTEKNQTMKMVGYVKKRRLNVLVDSGSTHNFWIWQLPSK